MTPERFETVKRLVVQLEALPIAERSSVLDSACAGDAELRAEVESLMQAAVPSIMQTGGLASRVAPMLADDRAIGRAVGPYRLVEVLGEGGMGVVYRAEQTAPIEREVALKLVPLGMNTVRVLERFESERQALALMNHPYIAHALEAGASDDGRPYFVMELVRGEPITEYCARHELPLSARLALFLQVCEGIQHAHQRGIIHRDLKPSNVLVTRHGAGAVPKIIDFGIAKAVGEAGGKLQTTIEGQLIGTPEYMSPEQAGVIDAGLDTRTDVYSLGVMLYELVSGRRPYELKKRTAIELERALRTPPVPPSRVEPSTARWTAGSQVSRDIDAVALMAMERMPDDRYASVEQLADDVRRVIEHRPVRARQQTWTYRTGKFLRRHAAAVATAAVVGGLVVAATVGIVIQRNRALASEQRAVLEAARARTEAQKASEVARFLTDLFRESDPENARGRAVTARELLDKGAKELESGLGEHGAVRAELMSTIGDVYRALGAFDEADRITADAFAIRRRELGAEHPDIAASLHALGQLAWERTRYEEAEKFHRDALAMRRKLLPRDDPAVAESLNNLTVTLLDRGQHAEAETLIDEAVAIRRAKLGDEHADTLISLNVRGSVMSAHGRYADAERSYRAVLDVRRKVLPADHPRIATSLDYIADMMARDSRLEEAATYYREALAIRRKSLVPQHPAVTASLVDLGSTLHDLGRLEEAEALVREALALDRQNSGGVSMDVAIDLNNLASVIEDRGRLDEALPLYRESMALRLKLQGEKHPAIAIILNNLGRVHFTRGALAEAEQHFRRALDIRTSLELDTIPRQGETMVWLGRVLEARGQLAEAERLYSASLAIQRKTTPMGTTRTAEALLALGRVMVRNKRAAEAEPLLREALTFRRKSVAQGHRAIGDAEAALADCLIAQARWPEAAGLLESAVKAVPPRPSPLLYSRNDVLALIALARSKAPS